MQIQTLYRQHDSIHGVIAIRAELISENVISVHDYETRQFPNNIDALAEAGYYTDPVQAKNHEE
jgi:hypothetical protein